MTEDALEDDGRIAIALLQRRSEGVPAAEVVAPIHPVVTVGKIVLVP